MQERTEVLYAPLVITSRLMAGVRIGTAEVAVERCGTDPRGRPAWRYTFDLPGGVEHEGADLWGPRTSREAVETLLSFVEACAEGFAYQQATGHESDNAGLFPLSVAEWAARHSDEIALLRLELEEQGGRA